MRLVLLSSPLLLLVMACPGDDGSSGDDVTDTSATAGTTAATTMMATTDASASGSMSATSAGTTTSADGSSDDAPACPPFTDEASPGAITIDVVNMRPEGVWLPMSPDCIDPVPFVLTGPDGTEAAWRGPGCGTCEGAVQGDCPCPPPFCDEVTALYLEPGATAQYSWAGLVHVEEEVPRACPGIPECGPSCQRAIVPAAGDYTFTVQAGGATGCAVEPCDCMPMGGSCTLLDPGMSFTMLTDYGGAVTLPGGASVQISID